MNVLSICNAMEQNLPLFVIMVHVYVAQDTSKLTGSATQVKYVEVRMINIILSKLENYHTPCIFILAICLIYFRLLLGVRLPLFKSIIRFHYERMFRYEKLKRMIYVCTVSKTRQAADKRVDITGL